MSITRKDDRTEIAIDELMEGAEWYAPDFTSGMEIIM